MELNLILCGIIPSVFFVCVHDNPGCFGVNHRCMYIGGAEINGQICASFFTGTLLSRSVIHNVFQFSAAEILLKVIRDNLDGAAEGSDIRTGQMRG